MVKQTKSGGEATRAALIEAGLKLFGTHGYDAVSTRQIADAAEANIGSIAYHFGGKPGLRLACAQFVAGGSSPSPPRRWLSRSLPIRRWRSL